MEKRALDATRQEMGGFEVQKEEAAQEVVETYKVFEECHQEKLAFSIPTFTEGMDDTRKRVTKCYPYLNLDFLDEDDLVDDAPIMSVPALEAGVESLICAIMVMVVIATDHHWLV